MNVGFYSGEDSDLQLGQPTFKWADLFPRENSTKLVNVGIRFPYTSHSTPTSKPGFMGSIWEVYLSGGVLGVLIDL